MTAHENNQLPLAQNLQALQTQTAFEGVNKFNVFYRTKHLTVQCEYCGHKIFATGQTYAEAMQAAQQKLVFVRQAFAELNFNNTGPRLPKGVFTELIKQYVKQNYNGSSTTI